MQCNTSTPHLFLLLDFLDSIFSFLVLKTIIKHVIQIFRLLQNMHMLVLMKLNALVHSSVREHSVWCNCFGSRKTSIKITVKQKQMHKKRQLCGENDRETDEKAVKNENTIFFLSLRNVESCELREAEPEAGL